MNLVIEPTSKLAGEITVPADKSISHRSIVLSSIARGTSHIHNILESEDVISTMNAFRNMGINIQKSLNGQVTVEGNGNQGLSAPINPINCGNSGTAMRILTGILASQNFTSKLIGDHSLMQRPMGRVVNPLIQMNARISLSPNGNPPIIIDPIDPNTNLRGIDYIMPVVSAQVKSAIILAALSATSETSIVEQGISRDHTERMLKSMGGKITVQSKKILVSPLQKTQLQPITISIPGDFSSAAFWMVASTIAKKGKVLLKRVGMNPTRTGAIKILELMGAKIQTINPSQIGGEPISDLLISSSQLKGITIPTELISIAIDEFPCLFIAAASAEGVTRLTNAGELRIKESDRLASMSDGLNILGIQHRLLSDGIIIKGNGTRDWQGGEIKSYADHRVAMSFTIAALRANSPILIKNCHNIQTSYPNFVSDAKFLGLGISSS